MPSGLGFPTIHAVSTIHRCMARPYLIFQVPAAITFSLRLHALACRIVIVRGRFVMSHLRNIVVTTAHHAFSLICITTVTQSAFADMKQKVILLIRADNEIGRRVVGPITIDVMHDSASRERPPQRTLCNSNVLQSPLAALGNLPIPLRIHTSCPAWSAPLDRVTCITILLTDLVMPITKTGAQLRTVATDDRTARH